MARIICPSCGTPDMAIFFELENIPAHSVLLMSSKEEAQSYPRGNVALGFCRVCGFISNVVFDHKLHEYSARYEETQGFSETFNTFHRELAARVIEQNDLHGKDIIEIGCGKGEFLALLCEMGDNRGMGFDPAFIDSRGPAQKGNNLRFVKDFYSEKYADHQADFICCKMTLEHIDTTADFISTVRRSIGDRSDTVVFFQVPDVARVLEEQAFWDIYYEHCSYFSAGSLARLFRKCGFTVTGIERAYDDQYLMITARPGNGDADTPFELEETPEALEAAVTQFAEKCRRKMDGWREKLQEIKNTNQRAVLWGAGSKGVAFLTALNVQDEIGYAVDINPHKHGTYMAGTGHEIVSPDFLRDYKPDVVIVMNPVYCKEIGQSLTEMGLDCELVAV